MKILTKNMMLSSKISKSKIKVNYIKTEESLSGLKPNHKNLNAEKICKHYPRTIKNNNSIELVESIHKKHHNKIQNIKT
jgi:hypothetical protein